MCTFSAIIQETMSELTNNVSSAIARSNSILSRVIADVNITLTSLTDRVTALHDQVGRSHSCTLTLICIHPFSVTDM